MDIQVRQKIFYFYNMTHSFSGTDYTDRVLSPYILARLYLLTMIRVI